MGNRKSQTVTAAPAKRRPKDRSSDRGPGGGGDPRGSSSGWLTRLPISPEYLQQSRRPLVSLAFVVPLLLTYEGGIVYLGPAALRNGADVWLRHWLGWVGFGQYFLLPALTVGVLLAWHHTTRERWRMSRQIVLAMYCECAVLAFGLLGIGYLERNLSDLAVAALGSSAESDADPSSPDARYPLPARPAAYRAAFPATALTAAAPRALPTTMISYPTARLVGFCGAGIYEEVLFRLLLLPPVVWLLGILAVKRPWRLGLAIVATSVIFSAAHYIGPHGESLEWFSASFRCVAGAFFATLFVYRGFGIAAGTHALYDVLVGLA